VKDLFTQLGKAVAITRIGNKDGHCHHIGQAAPGLSQRLAQPGKNFADLPVEITGERLARRADLSRQPYGSAALGDDCL
jgi:hypothetical protein